MLVLGLCPKLLAVNFHLELCLAASLDCQSSRATTSPTGFLTNSLNLVFWSSGFCFCVISLHVCKGRAKVSSSFYLYKIVSSGDHYFFCCDFFFLWEISGKLEEYIDVY